MINKELYNFFKPIFTNNKFSFILIWINWLFLWLVWVISPYLIKIETDQLVNKSNVTLFWKEFWAIEVFILILLLILIFDLLENIIQTIITIIIDSKKTYLKNQFKFKIYSRYNWIEIWKFMNARFTIIKKLIEKDFDETIDMIIDLPKNIVNFTVLIVWLSAIYYFLDFKLLLIVIMSWIIWYFLNIIIQRISKKYELTIFGNNYEAWLYDYFLSYDIKNISINWWLKSILDDYKNFIENDLKNNTQKEWSKLIVKIWILLNENLLNIILKFIVWYWVFIWTQSLSMVWFVVLSMWKIKEVTTNILELKNKINIFKFNQESIYILYQLTNKIWNKIFEEKIEKITIKNLKFKYEYSNIYEKKYVELLKKFYLNKELWDNYYDRKVKELFEGLTSNYENNNILNWINIEFARWKVYWIVGKNWAGKTTLTWLIGWFFRKYEWNIIFNNTEIINLYSNDIIDKISYLTQSNFYLWWWTSIYKNLTYWCINIDEEKMRYYLEKFWLKEKIIKLKDWIHTELWKHVDFSGWELQIINFIRLLLRNTDIIIMDEWTNQLDAENEILVMNELLKNKHDKIIIFVTHRMSTISKADEIYCLEDWIISDFWNHKELLQRENAYSRFYKAQILHDNI